MRAEAANAEAPSAESPNAEAPGTEAPGAAGRRADLYFVNDAQNADSVLLRLATKVTRQGMRVYVHCASDADAEALDDLLWRLVPSSFLPHALHSADCDAPVILGGPQASPPHREALVNRAEQLPAWTVEFERALEIVLPARQALARQQYLDLGYTPNIHTIP